MFRKSKSIKRFVAVVTAAAVIVSGISFSGKNAEAEETNNIKTEKNAVDEASYDKYEISISQGDSLEIIKGDTSFINIAVDDNAFDNNYDKYKDVFSAVKKLTEIDEISKEIGECLLEYKKEENGIVINYYNKNNEVLANAGVTYSKISEEEIEAIVSTENHTYDFSVKKNEPGIVNFSKDGKSGYSIVIAEDETKVTYKEDSVVLADFSKSSTGCALSISKALISEYDITIKVNGSVVAQPSIEPTATPEPTTEPTVEPTAEPTAEPTKAPTAEPTKAPTEAPTATPTAEPTKAPTEAPTATPTAEPTKAPTEAPTAAPTAAPTKTPDIESLVSTQPSNNSVALSWTVSNPSAAQTYEILLDGAVFATGVTTTSYTCTGLAAGSHTIKVVAVNGAVKSAGKSVSVSVKMEISIKKNGVSHVYMYDADKPYVLPGNHKEFIAAYPELVTKGYVFDGFLDAGRKLVKSVSAHSELTIKWRPLSTKFSSVKLKKGTLTFKFSKADWNNIDGYKISYSLDRKMKKKVKSITVAKKGKKQVYNFTKAKKLLKNGAIYYFNVKFYYKNKAGKKVFYEGNTTNKPIRYYKK